ncbi:serine/threonine protein kinase [Naegleria gruberi]|uniref:Serine/threonine protein kinase n=1 Tax=Naegleria gruberi TaxID=5762 RepID=D2V8B1_NAEGR|nr:serine/threonine protein kinase [Naegleria gruberi]EFC47148.1 serine/threonine protein kinase [Naegleria gruberi]|eukprot:XP_002679892.1 serine/threonine protein kinase [Naegleria gruberi strain NEG-M]
MNNMNKNTSFYNNSNTICYNCCENVSLRKQENFVNYLHHHHSKEVDEQSPPKYNLSSPTTTTTIIGKYSLIGRTILIFTYLICIYYLLVSTIFNINILTDSYMNNNNNTNQQHLHSYFIVNAEQDLFTIARRGMPRPLFSSYPVTCSPYPAIQTFQILSAGLPTSGALGNGTVVTLPTTSTFANYIVLEPWLVIFPSLTTRSKGRTTIADGNGNGNNGNGNGNGNGNNGKPQEPPRALISDDDYTIRVRKVATSYTHTVVIGDEEKDTKYLFGFGLNDDNSLGLSTELNQSVMVDPSDNDIIDLDKSSTSTVPELTKKDIRKKPNKIPQTAQAPSFDNIGNVLTGDGFTVVVTKNEKQLYTCGRNNKYQLGLDTKAGTWNQLPLKNISLIDTGADHTVVVHNNYFFTFFGSNANVQMGNITLRLLGTSQTIPVSKTAVPLQFDLRNGYIEGPAGKQKKPNIISVQASRYFTIMLTDEGSLIFFGQLESAFKYPNIIRNSNFLEVISFSGVNLSTSAIGGFKDSFSIQKPDPKFEATVSAYYLDRFYFSSGITKILACDKFFAVLLNNNTIWISDNTFRGVNGIGLLIDPILIQKQVLKMVCGRRHLVVLMQDNTTYTVGSNYYGQLGLRGVSYSSKLNFVRGDVSDIEAADFTTFLIANQSKLYAFGMNNMGQLGVTSASSSRSLRYTTDLAQDAFAVVDFGSSMNYSISTGAYQTFIASLNGTFVSGLNYNNMFGIDGAPEKLYSPTNIELLRSPSRMICATLQNAFTIRDSTSELIMLGTSGYITQNPPYGIPKGVVIANVTCGAYHILVTDDNNNLYAAGFNGNGQLGVGNEVNSPELVKVNWNSQANGKIFQTSCGAKHSLVLTEKGAFAFGDNTYGQLGVSGIDKSSSPIKIPIDNPVAVYAGFYHSHILTRNGTLLAFGRNDYQQLGPLYGGGSIVTIPTAVNFPYAYGGIADIQSGAFHTVILTSTGMVYAYGNNDYGQLGFSLDKTATSAEFKFGSNNSPRIAISIAAGAFHSVVLTSPYIPNVCPSVKCSGLDRSYSSVCSANGTCVANDLCMCNAGYTGENCQYFSCFGLSANDPSACSGSGLCLNLVGTPVSGSDPYSNRSGNIRTFLNISQVSTAMTLTKSMMDDSSGNNLQLSSNASQNRLNGSESMLIDRFVNLMKIGEGSFGLVFKGQDTKQNFQWKAIKLIRFSDLNELNQTLREATHLLRMVHPHIVRVNDVFIDANQHMLCMEMDYYELGDFEQFMNNQCYLGQTVLSETLVSHLIYQICSALDYMNTEYNMIHRDIKPSNIFIKSFDYHRSQIHIVLGDFGLAKKGRNSTSGATSNNANISRVSDSSDINLSQALVTGDANTLLSTQMGFAGTPIYMSWEAIVQGKNCFQTDIFALGVTAYQCLTGDRQTCITQLYLKEHQRRQLNLNLMSSEKDVENLVRENIIKCSPNCSIELVDMVMQMLKKNPEDRPKPSDVTNSSYFSNKY